MTDQPCIYIVDDDPSILDALSLMLSQEGMVVKTYESGPEFLETCREGCYGCAIIDIRMPNMDGLQLQETLTQLNLPLAIIFLTGHGNIPMSVKAIKAGAVDFITKPVTRDKLMASVQSALEESQKRLAQVTNHHDARSRIATLTERELEVMRLAIAGFPNKEIARRLDISHRTVEIHKSRIMHKTGASNLLDLARLAQEGGQNIEPIVDDRIIRAHADSP